MDLEAAAAGKSVIGDMNATIRDQNMTYKRKQYELEMKRQQQNGSYSPTP